MTDTALEELKRMKTPLAEKHEPTKEDKTIADFKAFYKQVCETKDYGVSKNDRTNSYN